MNELIVFPDVLHIARTGLLARLGEVGYAGVQVVETVPPEQTRPDRFVRLMRTGGARDDLVVDRAMLTIEAWARWPVESMALAQAARAVLNAMPGTVVAGVPVYNVVEFSGPAASPDPVSGTPRHTWTVEIAVRGTAA